MALTLDEFTARAGRFLAPQPLDESEDFTKFGCHSIAELPPNPAFITASKPAAVLVPILIQQGELSLLLTERAAHLKAHAGQVAFPGGRIERGETAQQAAIREAGEEIGLAPSRITPLGFLPPYYSSSGFRIQPLIALILPNTPLVADENEVARIFEIPLAHALDLAHYKRGTILRNGQERIFTILEHKAAYIWGVTAGILRSFAEKY